MSRARAAALLLLILLVAGGVGGVVAIMQVRLRGDEVGQRIRRLEREIAERRKEVDDLERQRARAQDVLQLARRIGQDLRPPEPAQVVWVRPPPAANRPLPQARASALTPRLAAMNAAGGDPSGQGGAVRR